MKEEDQCQVDWKNQWDRYQAYENPYMSMVTELDVTNFLQFIEEYNKPFFVSFLYCVTRVANEIPAFRRRVNENGFIEHETLNVSIPFGTLKRFEAKYMINLFRFVEYTLANMELFKTESKMVIEQDNVLHALEINVDNFRGITLPTIKKNDIIPRVTWSHPSQNRLSFGIQVHMGLVSELEVSGYIEKLQELLTHPEYYIKPLAKDSAEEDENAYDTRIIRTSSLSQRMRSEYPYEIY